MSDLIPASIVYREFGLPRNLLRQLADDGVVKVESRLAPDRTNQMFFYSEITNVKKISIIISVVSVTIGIISTGLFFYFSHQSYAAKRDALKEQVLAIVAEMDASEGVGTGANLTWHLNKRAAISAALRDNGFAAYEEILRKHALDAVDEAKLDAILADVVAGRITAAQQKRDFENVRRARAERWK